MAAPLVARDPSTPRPPDLATAAKDLDEHQFVKWLYAQRDPEPLPEAREPKDFDQLIAHRDKIAVTFAKAWARYGQDGTAKEHRDSLLSRLRASKRAEMKAAVDAAAVAGAPVVKITEDLLDDYAQSHPEFVAWIVETERGRQAFQLLKTELTNIEDLIRHDDAVVRLRTAEARL